MKEDRVPGLKHVAFIGNHLPRKCGIATFTTDVSEAFSKRFPEIQTTVLAMNDTEEGYGYPEAVRYQLRDNNPFDYERAANFLNQHGVDVINLQHEFGIFGGNYGKFILTLLRNLNIPVVTTLHTVLEKPDIEQQQILREVARLSNRLIVMSEHSRDGLRTVYDVPYHKIDLIPHGIHDVPFVDPSFHKDKFEAEGKFVLLTFGLLSPTKGIEYVIEALPQVVKHHPNLVYLVLGATHPHVVAWEGEAYRDRLQKRVNELGLQENVRFYNQFVELESLKEFIGAADIYITPYLNPEQDVSGALAYTVGGGKAVISTPYRYARELLSEGRGLLVPFRDSNAIAEQILFLLGNEAERSAMRKRAYLHGRDMIWPIVAESYRASFDLARHQHFGDPYLLADNTTEEQRAEPIRVTLDHIERLSDGTGILQHAVYGTPNYNEGYTTDDNARALILAVQMEGIQYPDEVQIDPPSLQRMQELGNRYLAFLWHAFNPENKRFRNFMSYDRRWLEEAGSEDSHGRALWALGVVLSRSQRESWLGTARRLFEASLPVVGDFTSPRSWAFALLGIHQYLQRYLGDRAVLNLQDKLTRKLLDLYHDNRSENWHWFEEVVTYCNPVLSQALLQVGRVHAHEEALRVGLESLFWLMKTQGSNRAWIMPIGNQGFYRKDGQISYYDQQPVEVYSLLSACLEAYRASDDQIWEDYAMQTFEWFHGRNALGVPVIDKESGGCRDGLHIDRLNENQGAESTLSYLQACLEMHQFLNENGSQAQSTDEEPTLLHVTEVSKSH